MTVKVIVIKVSVICEKTKTMMLIIVAKLQGVNEIKVDVEKGTVTIVGTVDPVCIITQLRKAKICAEITSVGPPKKPDPPKPEPCKPCCSCPKCRESCKPWCSCPKCRVGPPIVCYDPPFDPPGCRFW